MLNVYDIVLNLLDGNRIYEPFEWSNKDNIEHIKKIPMVRISSNFLSDIILNNVTVNKDFLQSIYRLYISFFAYFMYFIHTNKIFFCYNNMILKLNIKNFKHFICYIC